MESSCSRGVHLYDALRNALAMKPLCLSLAAALLLAPVLTSAEETLKERAKDLLHDTKQTMKKAAGEIANSSREAWRKSQAYTSDDPAVYRRAAEQRLGDISAEITNLQQNAPATGRPYFATYLTALQQQSSYAKDQLTALTPEEIRQTDSGHRQRFDLTVDRLEEHLDLAEREARDFISPP